jgi:hypothetical protein
MVTTVIVNLDFKSSLENPPHFYYQLHCPYYMIMMTQSSLNKKYTLDSTLNSYTGAIISMAGTDDSKILASGGEHPKVVFGVMLNICRN